MFQIYGVVLTSLVDKFKQELIELARRVVLLNHFFSLSMIIIDTIGECMIAMIHEQRASGAAHGLLT